MLKTVNPTHTNAWKSLQTHFEETKDITIKSLFASDPTRAEKFSLTFNDQIFVDYSKNRITAETLNKLQALAKECGLSEAIKSMFSGEKINQTEDRAVLHITLH